MTSQLRGGAFFFVSLTLSLSLSLYLCVDACMCVWSSQRQGKSSGLRIQRFFLVFLLCCIAKELKQRTNGTSKQDNLHHSIIRNACKERKQQYEAFCLQISISPGCYLLPVERSAIPDGADLTWLSSWLISLPFCRCHILSFIKTSS